LEEGRKKISMKARGVVLSVLEGTGGGKAIKKTETHGREKRGLKDHVSTRHSPYN